MGVGDVASRDVRKIREFQPGKGITETLYTLIHDSGYESLAGTLKHDPIGLW